MMAIIIIGYVVCSWFVVGAITIWYLLCRSRIKDEYLDRINDVTDVFTATSANRRITQYFLTAVFVTVWPIVATMATLETIGRGRSNRGDC